VELSVVMKWEEVTTTMEEVVLKTYEQSNTLEDFVLPKWRLVEAMEAAIDHT
jgi:hypothetical protein